MNIETEQVPLEEFRKLSPGVRHLVLWLNQQGFKTTDSGDGSNHADGMECAVPHPMVAIVCRAERMVDEARRLKVLLEERGLVFKADGPDIQASYDPADDSAVIVLMNVLSEDARL